MTPGAATIGQPFRAPAHCEPNRSPTVLPTPPTSPSTLRPSRMRTTRATIDRTRAIVQSARLTTSCARVTGPFGRSTRISRVRAGRVGAAMAAPRFIDGCGAVLRPAGEDGPAGVPAGRTPRPDGTVDPATGGRALRAQSPGCGEPRDRDQGRRSADAAGNPARGRAGWAPGYPRC